MLLVSFKGLDVRIFLGDRNWTYIFYCDGSTGRTRTSILRVIFGTFRIERILMPLVPTARFSTIEIQLNVFRNFFSRLLSLNAFLLWFFHLLHSAIRHDKSCKAISALPNNLAVAPGFEPGRSFRLWQSNNLLGCRSPTLQWNSAPSEVRTHDLLCKETLYLSSTLHMILDLAELLELQEAITLLYLVPLVSLR